MKTIMIILLILCLTGCVNTNSPIEPTSNNITLGKTDIIIPDTTRIVAPRNNSYISTPLKITWKKVLTAKKYWLCVSIDKWKTLMINDSTLTDTTYTIKVLPPDTKIVYNLAVGNDAGWNTSAWKNEYTFTTPDYSHWSDGVILFNLVPLMKFNAGDIQKFEVSTLSNPGDIGVAGPMTITAPDGYLVYFNEQPEKGYVKSFVIQPYNFMGIPTIWGKTIQVKCVTGGMGSIIVSVKDRLDVIHNAPIPVFGGSITSVP